MKNIEYQRLLDLKEKIDNKEASPKDLKDYMLIMYENGHITEKQYKDFISNKNTDDLIKAAITIGGVLLAAWLIQKLFE
ncbi:hypothetical protein [Saccharicrinis sp. GN24d3]|uniref:hypothetical protein n=1 Tax=Saccharicrinis sp. GN24d3 TaxID=3458416 RepID=UPI00403666B3